MKNNNFIMLPNNIVWSHEDKETMYNMFGNKVPYVIAYLVAERNRISISRFTLKDLIESCGLKCKNGKNGTVDIFKDLLSTLQIYKYIECDTDLSTIKPNDFIKCKVLLDFKTKKVTVQEDEEIIIKNKFTQFFKIDIDEYYRLIESNSKLDTCTLINIYFYIVARLRHEDNKAIVCYMSYDTILNDLNISKNTLNKYLDYLKDNNFIYFDRIGNVENNGKIIHTRNVYSLDNEELNKGLEESKVYYKVQGYTIVSDNTKSTVMTINGLKGRIKQLKSQGKDTKDLEDKLQEELNKIKPKDEKISNEELDNVLNCKGRSDKEVFEHGFGLD